MSSKFTSDFGHRREHTVSNGARSCYDNTVCFWDVSTDNFVVQSLHFLFMWVLYFSPSGKLLISGGSDGNIYVEGSSVKFY